MSQESSLRSTLIFFNKIGIYDVVLPFLLVFSIVFAVLDKSRVLGVDKIEGQEVTKKNLNAMIAFVIAFLTIASSQIVAIINKTASYMVLLLVFFVSFLLLVGSFSEETGKALYLEKGWKVFFMVIAFIGMVLIFLNTLTYQGTSWYMHGWRALGGWLSGGTNELVSSIILLGVVGFFIWFIAYGGESNSGSNGSSS